MLHILQLTTSAKFFYIYLCCRILVSEKITSGIAWRCAASIFPDCVWRQLRLLRYQSRVQESFVDVCLEDREPIRWAQWKRVFRSAFGALTDIQKLWFIAKGTDQNMDAIPHHRSVLYYEEMGSCYSWEAILCIFWLCYNRWNDGILFYQDFKERVWRKHNSANQKTKNDFLEIW